MLKPFFVLAGLALVIAWGVGSGALGFLARMLSRILVSDRRRDPPEVRRGGGVSGLPRPLARWVARRRELEAAVADLQAVAPAYHRSFEAGTGSVLEDRRRQAARRDFEDAVIHVTRALDALCADQDRLDDESRARLHEAGPVPDAAGLLRSFPWLPRQVHEIGTLHYRDDAPAFDRRLLELDEDLRRVEDALTHGRGAAYR